jgi:hypothetical protein
MKRLLLVGLIIVVVGCSSRWVQEGKGYIETRQDGGACADSILAGHRELNDESMKECMEGKGYRRHGAPHRAEGASSPPVDGQHQNADPAP